MTAGLLYRWRMAVQRSDLHATSRNVAWTLSTHMNREGGSCWPSINRVARESGLSRRTVQRHVVLLEVEGWLRVERSKGGQNATHRYQATFPPGLNGVTATP